MKWERILKDSAHLAVTQISKRMVNKVNLETRRHLFDYILWKTSVTKYLIHLLHIVVSTMFKTAIFTNVLSYYECK